MRVVFVLCFLFLYSGSLDAAFLEGRKSSRPRTEPDFIHGEVITTSNGAVVKGSFGESSEKLVLKNGVVIEVTTTGRAAVFASVLIRYCC